MFSDRSFAVVTARARNLISEWCSIVEDCGRCCGFSDRILQKTPFIEHHKHTTVVLNWARRPIIGAEFISEQRCRRLISIIQVYKMPNNF